MATFDYVLKLSDGTTTIILTSSPFAIREWQPKTGADDEFTVTETCEVRVTDGAVADNLVEMRAMNKLLIQAADAQRNRSLAKVYLIWKENTAGSEWRSEVKRGRAEWNPEATTLTYWRGDTQFVLLHWERVNYWEGAEAQLALTNPNGTNNTDGLTVYNCNDLTGASPNNRANYVDITGTAVLGDIPGATRMEITNTYNVAADLSHLWIGQNIFTPSSFDHWIEGEEATGGTVVSGGEWTNYSNSGFIRDTATGSETKLLSWTLSDAQVVAAGGRLHRITFRSTSMANWNVFRFRLKIAYYGVPVWQSDLVQPDSAYALSIRNLFTVKIPPWLGGMTSLDGLDLELYGNAEIESPGYLEIDYIQLTPTDGYREIHTATYSIPYGTRIMDDGINDVLYIDDGAGVDKAGILTSYGAPIHVWPGRNQRLYFLMHANTTGTSEIVRTISVKLYYRPRRRTI